MKKVKTILKKPAEEISESMELDTYSKKIMFIDHIYAIIYSAIHKCDLTDAAINNNISKSQLSKLNTNRSYIPFMLLFYKFVDFYIKSHDYKKYSRYMRIIGIDSTLLKTSINGSGKYHGTEINGIKLHTSSIVYPYTLPLDVLISSANKHDSSFLNELLENMDNIDDKLLYSSILVFDLGYYNLERFHELKEKNILFVSRIKKNAVYESAGSINGHEIIRFNNGLALRIVRVNINNTEYDYITDILNLDDEHIAYAYNLRWNIEEFFKTMKSQLKVDKLISKSLNGILIQAFSYFIAYIILNMIIDSIGISISFSELMRGIRNGRIFYYNNKEVLDLSKI